MVILSSGIYSVCSALHDDPACVATIYVPFPRSMLQGSLMHGNDRNMHQHEGRQHNMLCCTMTLYNWCTAENQPANKCELQSSRETLTGSKPMSGQQHGDKIRVTCYKRCTGLHRGG